MKRFFSCLVALQIVWAAGAVTAQTPNPSFVSAGAAVSSERGFIGSFGFTVQDILGSGLDLGGEYRKGRKGEDARLRLHYTRAIGETRIGPDTQFFITANHARTDWESDAYPGWRSRAAFGTSAKPLPWLKVRGAVFGQFDRINDIREDTSPLILAEKGCSDTGGFEASVSIGRLDRQNLPRSGELGTLTVVWANMGARRFVSGEVSGTIVGEVVPDWILATKAAAGVIHATNGQQVSIHDRAFLGGSHLRGFAMGGAGPRDYVEGGLDVALGGSRYASGSVELRRLFPDSFAAGLFLDAGMTWDLGGDRMGASGMIDNSRFLRSSAGIMVYWLSPLGIVSLSVATPLRKLPTDRLNNFSLNLVSHF